MFASFFGELSDSVVDVFEKIATFLNFAILENKTITESKVNQWKEGPFGTFQSGKVQRESFENMEILKQVQGDRNGDTYFKPIISAVALLLGVELSTIDGLLFSFESTGSILYCPRIIHRTIAVALFGIILGSFAVFGNCDIRASPSHNSL